MSIPPPSASICRPRAPRARRWCWPPGGARARGGHDGSAEGDVADRRQAAAALAARQLQEGKHQRHHGGRRISRGCHRHARGSGWSATSAMRRRASWHRSPARSTRWRSDTVISYGDLLFRSYVLRDLVESKPISRSSWIPRRPVRSTARCAISPTAREATIAACSARRCCSSAWPARTSGTAGPGERGRPHGRWIGMLNVSRQGLAKLKAVMAELRTAAGLRHARHAVVAERVDRRRAAVSKCCTCTATGAGSTIWRNSVSAVDFAHAQTPFGSDARTPQPRIQANDRSARTSSRPHASADSTGTRAFRALI